MKRIDSVSSEDSIEICNKGMLIDRFFVSIICKFKNDMTEITNERMQVQSAFSKVIQNFERRTGRKVVNIKHFKDGEQYHFTLEIN